MREYLESLPRPLINYPLLYSNDSIEINLGNGITKPRPQYFNLSPICAPPRKLAV